MGDFTPRRPSGSTPEALFQQSAWDKIHGQPSRIISTSTVKRNRTSKGYYFDAAPAANGGGIVKPAVVTQLFGDDFIGVTYWNPSSMATTGSQFNVAKCLSARMNPAETIDTIAFTYDYIDGQDNFRTQFKSAAEFEYQVMNPRYRIYDPTKDISESLIFVGRVRVGSNVTDDTGAQLFFLEIQPFRRWCFQNGQSGPPS